MDVDLGDWKATVYERDEIDEFPMGKEGLYTSETAMSGITIKDHLLKLYTWPATFTCYLDDKAANDLSRRGACLDSGARRLPAGCLTIKTPLSQMHHAHMRPCVHK